MSSIVALAPSIKILAPASCASLTYETVQRLGLGVMDLTAITLCQENDIPVVVFYLAEEGNIARALRGDKVGTCVSSDVEKYARNESPDAAKGSKSKPR